MVTFWTIAIGLDSLRFRRSDKIGAVLPKWSNIVTQLLFLRSLTLVSKLQRAFLHSKCLNTPALSPYFRAKWKSIANGPDKKYILRSLKWVALCLTIDWLNRRSIISSSPDRPMAELIQRLEKNILRCFFIVHYEQRSRSTLIYTSHADLQNPPVRTLISVSKFALRIWGVTANILF